MTGTLASLKVGTVSRWQRATAKPEGSAMTQREAEQAATQPLEHDPTVAEQG